MICSCIKAGVSVSCARHLCTCKIRWYIKLTGSICTGVKIISSTVCWCIPTITASSIISKLRALGIVLKAPVWNKILRIAFSQNKQTTCYVKPGFQFSKKLTRYYYSFYLSNPFNRCYTCKIHSLVNFLNRKYYILRVVVNFKSNLFTQHI